MNRSVCHVCQQQFKTASGHRWHLRGIHDLSDEAFALLGSENLAHGYEAGSPGSATSFESEVRDLIEALAGQVKVIAERVGLLNQELAESKGRLHQHEKTAQAVQALSGEVAGLSAMGVEIDTVMQAVVGLLWELDRPSRGSPKLTDLVPRVIVGASDLARFRETIKAFLRNQKLCVQTRQSG